MKRLLTLSLCIACAIPALASVIVAVPHLSTQRPRVTILIHDKPAANIPISVDLTSSYFSLKSTPRERHLKLITNASGAIKLPRLHPNYYSIEIDAKPNFEGDIYLAIAPGPKSSHYAAFIARFNKLQQAKATPRSAFSVSFHRYTTFAQWLAQNVIHLAALHGTVHDPTGAILPDAVLDIYRLHGAHRRHLEKLRANHLGVFAVPLRKGNYLVTVSSEGFRTAMLHIIIAEGAGNQPLNVTLRLPGVIT
jgi:hypothetical protein